MVRIFISTSTSINELNSTVFYIICFNSFTGQQNPEDVAGIKEAITILENHDSKHGKPSNEANNLQVVTPHPFVDERNNARVATRNETISPVYRANRNYNVSAKRTSAKRNSPQSQNSSELKSGTVNADKILKKDKETSSAENSRRQSSSAENTSIATSAERKHRRRMTLKHNNATTASTTIVPLITLRPVESTTPAIEIVKQKVQKNYNENHKEVRQEKLTDQLESADSIDLTILKDIKDSPTVKRFYRSSAERESNKEDQEMTLVNNEKIQIVRPTSMVKLVGHHATPTATIAKLDEAILGKIPNSRVKKEVVTVVTPQRNENQRLSTNRFRT